MKIPFEVPPRIKVAGIGLGVWDAVAGGAKSGGKEASSGEVAEGAAESGAVLELCRVCLLRRRWPAA